MIACALIFVNGVNLLQAGLKFLTKTGEMLEDVKSVEIITEDWEKKEAGSFQIEKSA